jgi:hypothetical protein
MHRYALYVAMASCVAAAPTSHPSPPEPDHAATTADAAAANAPTTVPSATADAVTAGGADGGAIGPEPPQARPILDERGCVTNAPEHAARFILEQHRTKLAEAFGRPVALPDVKDPHCFGSQALPDLDGDGQDEIDVSRGCAWGMYAALHVLYFSNRGCRRFAGAVIDGELRALETSNAGVRDVEATWSAGCAGRNFGWTRYRWNGKAYAAADSATCHFCDDPSQRPPPGANRHPHCKQVAPSFSSRP